MSIQVPLTADPLTAKIHTILAGACKDSPYAVETAELAATQLDGLRPEYRDVQDDEGFYWAFWSAFLGVVKEIPADDPRMGFLVLIVQKLSALEMGVVGVWGNELRVWRDLPVLGPQVREEWNLSPPDGPMPAWLSLNAFIARLHATGTRSWSNFAIWSIRSALETEVAPGPVQKCLLESACEWVIRAAEELHQEARLAPELSENDQRMLKAGELAQGIAPGLNLERWAFWRERLDTLGREVGGDVRMRTEEAVLSMVRAERNS